MKGASMASVSGGRVLIFSLRPEIASVPEVWGGGSGLCAGWVAGFGGAGSAGERVGAGIGLAGHAGGVVEAAELDAIPEGAEGEPAVAVGVLDVVRVDGVEAVGRFGFEDEALVDPLVVGAFRVEGLVDGEANAGGVFAEEE